MGIVFPTGNCPGADGRDRTQAVAVPAPAPPAGALREIALLFLRLGATAFGENRRESLIADQAEDAVGQQAAVGFAPA